MVSAQVSADRVIRVRALNGEIRSVLGQDTYTLTVPPSVEVYKRVPANFMLALTLQWTIIPSSGE